MLGNFGWSGGPNPLRDAPAQDLNLEPRDGFRAERRVYTFGGADRRPHKHPRPSFAALRVAPIRGRSMRSARPFVPRIGAPSGNARLGAGVGTFVSKHLSRTSKGPFTEPHAAGMSDEPLESEEPMG
jgi:hypothetical protein